MYDILFLVNVNMNKQKCHSVNDDNLYKFFFKKIKPTINKISLIKIL